MLHRNSLLIALVFVFVSYKIVEPWIIKILNPKPVTQKQSEAEAKSAGGKNARFFTERLSENMPKLYAWQRLLKLNDADSDEPYFSYLDEWLVNNPEQLFNKAFKKYRNGKLTAIQKDIVNRFTFHYKDQTQINLDTWFDGQASEEMGIIVCQSLAQYYPQHLESWFVAQYAVHHHPKAAITCLADLMREDSEKAESWFESTGELQYLPAIKAQFQILTQN